MVDAVLLMALGGPDSMDQVRPFIAAVLGGRKVPPRRIEEVVHHYEAVGGRSPLTELTLQQARALEARLASDGLPVPVFVGMRCWTPWLADTVREMARRGVRRAAVVILSAQPDRSTESQYQGSLANARNALDGPAPEFLYVPPWHDHMLYAEALADRIHDKMADVPDLDPATTPLLFSSHSLPARLAGIEEHVAAIRATCGRVAGLLSWRHWSLVYQSRTGRPDEPWLEPDVCSVVEALADAGHRRVLVACPGFVCDHVEVLYDLDIEAAGAAARRGLVYARAATVGAHPSFLRMLSELVRAL